MKEEKKKKGSIHDDDDVFRAIGEFIYISLISSMRSCPLAGPGPANSGPGPTAWVRGQQKVARPDLDRTVDTKMHRAIS